MPATTRTSAATMVGDLAIILGEHAESGDQVGIAIAYDTAMETWRTLEPPSVPISTRASVSSTGSQVFVWVAPVGRAIVYDVDTDGWSSLSEPPTFPRRADSVWTGEEWIVMGSDGDLCTGALGSGLVEDAPVVLAHDASAGTWERLPDAPTTAYDPPLLWTGTEAIIYADPLHRLQPPAG